MQRKPCAKILFHISLCWKLKCYTKLLVSYSQVLKMKHLFSPVNYKYFGIKLTSINFCLLF